MNWAESVQSDLAVMRKLAEQGGRLTMPGGRHYLVWGFAIGLGMLGHFLIGARLVPVPMWGIWVCYIASSVIGYTGTYLLARKEEQNPESARLINRMVATIWAVTGFSMMVFFFGTLATGASPALLGAVSCLAVGMAFSSIAVLTRMTWMLVPAAVWYVMLVVNLWMTTEKGMGGYTFLALAAATFVTMVGTGLKLLAEERAAHR